MNKKTLIPIALLVCSASFAADPQDPAATEQRLRQDVQSLLAHMAASGALGAQPQNLHLRVELPALSLEVGSAAAAASAEASPAPADGCGRISTFDVASPSAQQYHAKLILLDGSSPISGHETYRVSAGEHHLLVAEDIPTNFMGAGPIGTWRTRNHSYKPLTVMVKPGTTAMVAAQLHTDRVSEIS